MPNAILPANPVSWGPSRLWLQTREPTWQSTLDQVMSAVGASGLLCLCRLGALVVSGVVL